MGGSGLSSIAVVILGDSAAPKERGRYYGYFSITYTTAGAVGPALGGFIADHLHWSVIFWINIPLGLLALAVTSMVLHRLPRHERPHRLDVIGAILVVIASVSFMLALNLGGKNYAWLSPEVSGLFLLALGVGAGFVLRLVTAPEPLIPIVVLREPVVRWSVLSHAMGWAGIVTLNIFLPIYLQSVIGLSPTSAGLSVMVLMVGLNGAAGLSSPLVGRVKRYKLLPMMALVLSIVAVLVLALRADRIGPFWFEVLVLVIGMGFGPTSPVTAVAMQNAVARHQLGVSIGMMNFSRNLFTTILVALVGAIVLGVTSALAPGGTGELGGGSPSAQAAQVFGRMFYVIAAALSISFVALVLIEERPLRTRQDEEDA
jgi:MFS family permease